VFLGSWRISLYHYFPIPIGYQSELRERNRERNAFICLYIKKLTPPFIQKPTFVPIPWIFGKRIDGNNGKMGMRYRIGERLVKATVYVCMYSRMHVTRVYFIFHPEYHRNRGGGYSVFHLSLSFCHFRSCVLY